MSATAVTSVAHCRRLERARNSRGQSKELLLVGATLDGANELARSVAKDKGVAFGWHRLSISQLAFAMASPGLAARGLLRRRVGVGLAVGACREQANGLSAALSTPPELSCIILKNGRFWVDFAYAALVGKRHIEK
jgi:hypothetical protein